MNTGPARSRRAHRIGPADTPSDAPGMGGVARNLAHPRRYRQKRV